MHEKRELFEQVGRLKMELEWLKKKLPSSSSVLRTRVDWEQTYISMSRQCELLGLPRSTYYYEPENVSEENLHLICVVDGQYMRRPFFGSRKMALWLGQQGYSANRKRAQRLMRLMGIEAVYRKPRTTVRSLDNKVYPYLLHNVDVTHPDHVWCTDITYIPLRCGFMYLVAVMDWYSRYILSWRVLNSLDTSFCVDALEEALNRSRPEIFSSEQGVQFTSKAFTSILESHKVSISMDGKGRESDNIFNERLWRTIKYEDIYLKGCEDVDELYEGLTSYLTLYASERPHQALGYRTPYEVYQTVGVGHPN